MAKAIEATFMGHDFTAQRGKFGVSPGVSFEFRDPPLDSEQKANLLAHGLPVDMGQEDDSTKMFVTEQQLLEQFTDTAYVMTDEELGRKILILSQQEGRVENGR